jgi:[acyl-carrier-protein] S-malonyltransferase
MDSNNAMSTSTSSAKPPELALVFPGMTPSGYGDLAKFMMVSPRARRLREIADGVLDYPLMDEYRKAGEGYSEFSQVAFLISCFALAEWAQEELGIEPDLCAGASFGEKVAMAFAGSLTFSDTVRLTVQLARCEEEYFRLEYQDVVTQSVGRIAAPSLREILADLAARDEWCDISCFIDDDFFMVSMREQSLKFFNGAVRAAGGIPLRVMRPPMHSAAFGALRQRVADKVLPDFRFADPRLPIVSDQDGSVVDTADGVRSLLLNSIVRPVNWPDTLRSMRERGIAKIYIAGPDALFGRVRCATGNFDVVTVNQRMALRPKRPLKYAERKSA